MCVVCFFHIYMLKVRSMPIRKGDEVRIKKGSVAVKGKEGKVKSVYRKKWVIHVERVTREKANGQPVDIGISPSNVQIIKLYMDKDRKALLARKARARKGEEKVQKVQEKD